MNSCNPVFMEIGARVGIDRLYEIFERLGLMKKTGIDLPGEAATIMHKKDAMGNVELATVAFGQSFQITPIQLLCSVSAIINGGTRVTPHFALQSGPEGQDATTYFTYPVEEGVLSKEVSQTMRTILERVVAEGTGKNGAVKGFRIGGKTATSQTLPRGSGRYIASYIGFAPADDPQVIALAIVNNPKGIYYGGQVAAPIVRQLFENILPYLGVMEYNEIDSMQLAEGRLFGDENE
jgi:stage V sporulation protein D (sporulation-specific penicillin-binding protein)